MRKFETPETWIKVGTYEQKVESRNVSILVATYDAEGTFLPSGGQLRVTLLKGVYPAYVTPSEAMADGSWWLVQVVYTVHVTSTSDNVFIATKERSDWKCSGNIGASSSSLTLDEKFQLKEDGNIHRKVVGPSIVYQSRANPNRKRHNEYIGFFKEPE